MRAAALVFVLLTMSGCHPGVMRAAEWYFTDKMTYPDPMWKCGVRPPHPFDPTLPRTSDTVEEGRMRAAGCIQYVPPD